MTDHLDPDPLTVDFFVEPEPPGEPISDWDPADDMCPNCVTPWKCNGPHLADETPYMRRLLNRPAKGCAWLALFGVCLLFWAAVIFVGVNVVAAPSSGRGLPPTVTAQSGAPSVAPSPAQLERLRASTVGSGVGVRVESVPADQLSGAPPRTAGVPSASPSGEVGTAIIGGVLAYVDPKYGPLYLALPFPRGTVATICGPADCVTRRSTDFGPDQRVHPERIADLSASDWVRVCGMPLSAGLCRGTVELEPPEHEADASMRAEDSGPRPTLPPTNTEDAR